MAPEEIEVSTWVKRGTMMVNRAALDWNDPDHIYNHIVSLGYRPEDYGIKHPMTEEFEDKSRDELIDEIVKLRQEIEGYAGADAMGVLNRTWR